MPLLGLIRPLVDLNFWFDVRGIPFTPWADQLILALMLCFLLAAGAAWKVRRQPALDKFTRRIWQRLASFFLASGMAGLVLYIFTWQRVPVFSMRIFYLVWLIAVAIWAWRISHYAFQEVPAKRAQKAERAAYEKWLPKSKRS